MDNAIAETSMPVSREIWCSLIWMWSKHINMTGNNDSEVSTVFYCANAYECIRMHITAFLQAKNCKATSGLRGSNYVSDQSRTG